MSKLTYVAAGLAAAFLASQAAAAPAAEQRGQQVFNHWCAPCHAPGGWENNRLLPGTEALRLKYEGTKPAAVEEWTDITPEFVRNVVRQGVKAMPFFRKSEISDADLEALAAYLSRNTPK